MAEASRKQRERERHRREVLETAEAVFAEKGFHNATVQEIADRAEFAVGTIYNMFDGKTAIYQELVQMRAREYVDRVKARVASPADPREKVRAVIAAKLAFFEENQRFFRIFARATSGEGEHPPLALSEEATKLYADYIKAVSKVFAAGIRKKVFVDANPLLMTLMVEGTTNALMAHAFHTHGERVEGATAERIERLLFDGILTEQGKRP